MKYIDADRLKVEIERLKDKYPSWQLKLAMDDLCDFITSLQQDKETLDLCSQSWWEEMGWIVIPPNVTLKGIESLLERVRHKIKWNEENGFEEQEQPESICPRCVHRNKIDDSCEYPYGGRKCRINENGVYECNGFEEVEQQEQPDVDEPEYGPYARQYPKSKVSREQPVDLEKEYKTWWNFILGKINVEHMMEWYMHETARHFYELGQNARKEE